MKKIPILKRFNFPDWGLEKLIEQKNYCEHDIDLRLDILVDEEEITRVERQVFALKAIRNRTLEEVAGEYGITRNKVIEMCDKVVDTMLRKRYEKEEFKSPAIVTNMKDEINN